MSSQVVRVQGFSKGSLGAIGKEVERSESDIFENRNEDIDKNRTSMNEFFKHSENGMFAEWKDICKKMNVKNSENLKKNAIAFEGIVITSDQEYFKNLGYVPGQKIPKKVKNFFEKSYEFVKREIGFHGTDENVLCASVHYDETTPHLQVYYVPVVDNWKEKVLQKDADGKVLKNEKGSPIQARDKNGKLIWNEVTNSSERKLSRDSFWKNKGGNNSYTKMQDRYYEQISKEYGLGRGEKGSTREHTTKQEWEQSKLDKELDFKRKELSHVEQKTDKLKAELEYSRDGLVQVGMIPTKEKAVEVEKQNRALKREVFVLQNDNAELKAENGKLKAEKQAHIDELKDHSSDARRALDALDRDTLYKTFMKEALVKVKGLEEVMKPFEDMCAKAHEVGNKMLNDKMGYVNSLEARRRALERIKELQAQLTTLKTNSSKFDVLSKELKDNRAQLNQLKSEKEQCPSINIPRQLSLGKQIKEQTAKVEQLEKNIETKFNLPNQTDDYCLNLEQEEYVKKIASCSKSINQESEHADRLTEQAQSHLKAYKQIQSIQHTFLEPLNNIVSRYDSDYVPPQEYRAELSKVSSQGLERGKDKAQEETRHTMKEMKALINKLKAERMLEKQAEKPHSKDKGITR